MPHNLLLTGRPGIGKTTCVHRALALLPTRSATGFTTAEMRGPRGRVGFQATSLAGRTIVLAHREQRSPHRVGAYGVDVEAFERDIVPELDAGDPAARLFVVDEIGKMECFSAAFRAAVLRLLADERPLLGTVALHGPAFVQEVRGRPDVEVIELTLSNREALPAQIAARLRAWLAL